MTERVIVETVAGPGRSPRPGFVCIPWGLNGRILRQYEGIQTVGSGLDRRISCAISTTQANPRGIGLGSQQGLKHCDAGEECSFCQWRGALPRRATAYSSPPFLSS
jgi:hypothetical protein